MNKQHKLLASLIFFNLMPGLIFPNLAIKEMARENKAGADSPAEPQTGIYSQISAEINVITITAYSSTPEQTDSTPFITASGYPVEDGVVAANFLEFGTKIRIPELYGDKIFTVKDRMARKNSDKIDIWFPTTEEAKQFGVKKAKVEIVES